MINADEFLGPARAEGLDFYTGVPCSYLTPLINRVINDPANRYVGAASEGEASEKATRHRCPWAEDGEQRGLAEGKVGVLQEMLISSR